MAVSTEGPPPLHSIHVPLRRKSCRCSAVSYEVGWKWGCVGQLLPGCYIMCRFDRGRDTPAVAARKIIHRPLYRCGRWRLIEVGRRLTHHVQTDVSCTVYIIHSHKHEPGTSDSLHSLTDVSVIAITLRPVGFRNVRLLELRLISSYYVHFCAHDSHAKPKSRSVPTSLAYKVTAALPAQRSCRQQNAWIPVMALPRIKAGAMVSMTLKLRH